MGEDATGVRRGGEAAGSGIYGWEGGRESGCENLLITKYSSLGGNSKIALSKLNPNTRETRFFGNLLM